MVSPANIPADTDDFINIVLEDLLAALGVCVTCTLAHRSSSALMHTLCNVFEYRTERQGSTTLKL
jgi:hypothetical protein